MHRQMLRGLADVTARPLLIIFERSMRLGEVSEDWKKVNDTPIFKKGRKEGQRNDWSTSFHSLGKQPSKFF